MKLSNKYQYYILCEDAQMDSFINSFLKCNNINTRKRYTIPIPAGEGSGEAFVRSHLPREVRMLHVKKYINIVVIACTDADKLTVADREQKLVDQVKKEMPKWDYTNEMLLIWIPKREIETWIEYFKGGEVDEEMDFKHDGNPSSCKEEAEKMFFYCSSQEQYTDVLPSLINAKKEFERVCRLQSK